jgi:hypothetical protein
MYAVRRWSIRHARLLELLYSAFERLLVALAPLFRCIGYERLERPVAFIERLIKGFLFDCRMCGDCILSSTGMSCPMNCPKRMRNGPCGGVRADGQCEVRPDMRCVWVDAWDGARRMEQGQRIHVLQPQLDQQLQGCSTWLRVAREKGSRTRASEVSG